MPPKSTTRNQKKKDEIPKENQEPEAVLTKKPTAKKQGRKRKYSVDETLNENEQVLNLVILTIFKY